MVDLWVNRHESSNTCGNYRRQARLFLTFIRRPLATVGLGDLQAYIASLEPQAPATRANATAAEQRRQLNTWIRATGQAAQEIG
jgi:site-specific recombinase XerD